MLSISNICAGYGKSQILEDLLCERRAGGRDRGRALGDRSLDANPATDVQSLAEEAVENRSGLTGLVRAAHLAENLALARHE